MTYPSTTLAATCAAIEAAGQMLLKRFDTSARPSTMEALMEAASANEQAVGKTLEAALLAAVPGSILLDDEEPLPSEDGGHGWVVDTVEGNVNHVHGREGWAVTACLLEGRRPVLAAIYVPLSGALFTAEAGHGATERQQTLHVSGKSELRASIVATAQAKPFQDASVYQAMSRMFQRMLDRALLVRTSVPSTMELLDLAAGRIDAFWQHAGVGSGLAAGALLVREAGGIVTDTAGNDWHLGSEGFVASGPALHPHVLHGLGEMA